MAKTVIFGVILAFFVMGAVPYKIIRPTYRPPPRSDKPVIRYARQAPEDQPLWLHQGDDVVRAPSSADHPVLPSVIDDVNFGPTRHARSLGTPGRGRVGSNDKGNHGHRGHDTGATHPGHNRRNARSLHLPDFVTTPPFNPRPRPHLPVDRPRIPVYV